MTQLRFDNLLDQTETDNEALALRRKYPKLPSTWDAAIPYYYGLLQRCDAAFLAADRAAIISIYDEASALGEILNGGSHGLTAPKGAGTRLANETASPCGTVPLWGQQGEFIIEAAGMRIRMDMDGIFGVGTRYVILPGFGAHAVDLDRPF